MARFLLVRQIPSCHVDKKFLKQLENYLLNQVSSLIGISSNQIKDSYKFSVVDNLGAEEMSSISEYSLSQFPEGTGNISLELRVNKPRKLRLSIDFHDEKLHSWVSIDYEAENAREIVLGIYEGIKRIIEPQRTMNWIFYRYEEFQYVIGGATGVSFFFSILLFFEKDYYSWAINLLLFSILGVFLWIGKKVKPYISFETSSFLNRKKWSDWFVVSFLGYLIFGTFLVFLRKKLFGF